MLVFEMLKSRNVGIVVSRCYGILMYSYVGSVVYWQIGIWVCRFDGTMVDWYSAIVA